MKLIIDGYNVMKLGEGAKFIDEAERVQFLNRIQKYLRKKGMTALVVFDGGPYHWPYKERHKSIELVYSGMLETADHYITSYIDRYYQYDIMLISSDRELRNHAAERQVYSVTSQDFKALVEQALAPDVMHKKGKNVILHKFSSAPADPELDALMQEGTRSMMIKKEDVPTDEKIKIEKAQKHERAFLKKIKKM